MSKNFLRLCNHDLTTVSSNARLAGWLSNFRLG